MHWRFESPSVEVNELVVMQPLSHSELAESKVMQAMLSIEVGRAPPPKRRRLTEKTTVVRGDSGAAGLCGCRGSSY